MKLENHFTISGGTQDSSQQFPPDTTQHLALSLRRRGQEQWFGRRKTKDGWKVRGVMGCQKLHSLIQNVLIVCRLYIVYIVFYLLQNWYSKKQHAENLVFQFHPGSQINGFILCVVLLGPLATKANWAAVRAVSMRTCRGVMALVGPNLKDAGCQSPSLN